ncbi:histone H1.01-like [Scyliorhinus canicula]|uniref:histone H1.01-like n=1 Tax=Scyliorhinus canicula TaxID=7830 RepID=UPI0018F3298A|nr:histone H1.01-like [Scyliorhinus canicula]
MVSGCSDRKEISQAPRQKALGDSGPDVGKLRSRIKLTIKRKVAKGPPLMQIKRQGTPGSFQIVKKKPLRKLVKKLKETAAKESPVKGLATKKITAKKLRAKKYTVKKLGAKNPTARKSTKMTAPTGEKAMKSPKLQKEVQPKKRNIARKATGGKAKATKKAYQSKAHKKPKSAKTKKTAAKKKSKIKNNLLTPETNGSSQRPPGLSEKELIAESSDSVQVPESE